MARRDPNRAAHERIRKLIHAGWDQTGAPEDEYDTYAGRAYRMLVNGADAASIAAYLDEACKEEIAVGVSSEQNREIAAKIAALKGLLV